MNKVDKILKIIQTLEQDLLFKELCNIVRKKWNIATKKTKKKINNDSLISFYSKLSKKRKLDVFLDDISSLRLLSGFSLESIWNNSIIHYLLTNKFLFVPDNLPYFKTTNTFHEDELWVRIWPNTGIEEIKAHWPLIIKKQKTLKGYKKYIKKKKKRTKPHIIISAYERLINNKTYEKIADELTIKGLVSEKSVEHDSIRKSIKNYLKNLSNKALRNEILRRLPKEKAEILKSFS